ncbi:MAG: hypothetical protein FJW39_12400 [Acidobacteria bacterium]|nr:hypothetical protein [Acidobacteriota bacterium]
MVRLRIGIVFAASLAIGEESMQKPRYAEGNQLLRPEGYREWMFAGANYGMGYTDPQVSGDKKDKTFHNIFIQKQAYRDFARTGSFPEGTMLVMEVVKPGTNKPPNKQGIFQDEFVGIEVAVKDSSKFEEKWAYFALFEKGRQLDKAKAFPKNACWKCHNENGAADNVFVQFYPALRDARK